MSMRSLAGRSRHVVLGAALGLSAAVLLPSPANALAPAAARPVAATAVVTTDKPGDRARAAFRAELAAPLAAAAQTTGLGLAVDSDRALGTTIAGCRNVSAVTAKFAIVLLTARGGGAAGSVRLGAVTTAVARRTSVSRIVWVPLSRGSFRECASGVASVNVRLLAHTIDYSSATPGGVLGLTPRTSLPSRGSAKGGTWVVPASSTPSSAVGLILQVTSGTAGTIVLHTGIHPIAIQVGRGVPTQTLIIPRAGVTWSRASGTGVPSALLMGYVSPRNALVLGGARIHPVSTAFQRTGSSWAIGGRGGVPGPTAAIPATGALAFAAGTAGLYDPLAQSRPSGFSAGATPQETLLRLDSSGVVRFRASYSGTIVAWLGGDAVKAPQTYDLTAAGSVVPSGVTSKGDLVFPGQRPWPVGSALLLPISTAFPNGLVAIVDAVSVGATSTTVTYHAGGMADVYASLDLVAQVPLQSTGSSPALAASARIDHQDITPVNGSLGRSFNIGKSFNLGKNPAVNGSVNLQFHPSMSIVITIHTNAIGLPNGAHIWFALDGDSTLSATLTVGGHWGDSVSFPLGAATLGAAPLAPGIVVTPELSASLGLAVSADAAMTLSRSISEHAHVGMAFDVNSSGLQSTHGDWNNGFSRPSYSGGAPTFQFSADVTAKVTFEFILAIDGVAGPDAGATTGLAFHVDPSASPWWTLTASGDLGVGVNLNALGIPILTKSFGLLGIPTNPSWRLGHLSWIIASASGAFSPPAGGSGGAGSGSGASIPPAGSTGGWAAGGPGIVGGSSVGPVPAGSFAETTGGNTRAWTDYVSGGGQEGPTIASNQTVGVACRVPGLGVSDGDTWWYQVSSAPWSGDYYVSADAFYNNGATSGSLHGTPFVDSAVPLCHALPGAGSSGTTIGTGLPETAGGTARTWTDYAAAGGAEGPGVAGGQTIQVECATGGFAVADGNTNWYRIASSPWSDSFYVSADAFYNNGATSGTLKGTPFVDPAVPSCATVDGTRGGSTGGSIPGMTETTGGVTHTWTDYTTAGGTQGPSIASYQPVAVVCRVQGFAVADGDTWWYQVGSAPWGGAYYASADAFYNNGSTSGSLIGTPFVDSGVPLCGSGSGGGGGGGGLSGTTETVGGVTHTWTDYTNAAGTQGQSIAAYQSVSVVCRVQGFAVADGDTWWYEIGSSPWNGAFYASADAFYNNGATSGSLSGTPFVDTAVPVCGGSPAPTWNETVGGLAHTWTNYTNAGGTQGPSIQAFQTVAVLCRVQGFAVADGDTWWYRIGSSPWSGAYYASADAFYNNGATSGSLTGTPFVDTAVALC